MFIVFIFGVIGLFLEFIVQIIRSITGNYPPERLEKESENETE
jgi:hypothetical protein